MKKYISSIIVGILCLLTFRYGLFPSYCFGFPEMLLTMFFGVILFVVILIVLFIAIYKDVKQNYRPFVTLAICISILLLRQFFETELFLSDPILKANSIKRELVLRKNGTYELSKYNLESTCTETGTYKISHDTIYLREDPFFDQTLFSNEIFFIDRDSNLLKEVEYDGVVDSQNTYEITYLKD